MKIAMVSEHASPLAAIGGVDAGGQNLHVAELATALARRGDEVTVYTRRDCADLPEVVHAPTGFTVVHVPAGPPIAVPKDELLQYMPAFGDWLRGRWAGSTPDVVHAHFWMSGVAAARATAGRDIPVVLTYHALGSVKRRHQGEADTSPPQRIAIERQLGRRVDRVIAQCPDEVAELTELGVPAGSIDIIASGVDTNRFRPAGRAARRRGDLSRVLTVGRLVARKGYEDLIRAIASLPDAELVIAGGAPGGIAADPEARRLRTIADGLGVSGRVHMLGAVERALMPDWYRSADVVAATPWYEPFGLTPLEAMACGVPTVAYAVGGLRESIVDGVTGLHVRPGDIEQLAATLRRVLADQTARASLGRAGVARASTHYRWDGVANRIAAVYQACLRRRSQPAWPDERVAP